MQLLLYTFRKNHWQLNVMNSVPYSFMYYLLKCVTFFIWKDSDLMLCELDSFLSIIFSPLRNKLSCKLKITVLQKNGTCKGEISN